MMLGQLVERFILLEFMLGTTVERLIQDPVVIKTLVAGKTAKQLVELASRFNKEALERQDPRAIPALSDALQQVQQVLDERNTHFHNPSAPLPDFSGTAIRWDQRKQRLRQQAEPANSADLRALDRRVNEAMTALDEARKQ